MVFLASLLFSSVVLASAFHALLPNDSSTTSYPLPQTPRRRSSSITVSDASYNKDADDNMGTDHVRGMVYGMTRFLGWDMIDIDRFYYLCRPQVGERQHYHHPIRELAAAWDATKALLFWDEPCNQEWILHQPHQQLQSLDDTRQRLGGAICSTIRVYNASYSTLPANGGLFLDSDILLESPPNIAHSALMILASVGALRLSLFHPDELPPPPIGELVLGLLSMQRTDGAFQIEFASDAADKLNSNGDVYRGIEFYPGECMVALMAYFQLLSSDMLAADTRTRQSILTSMERAFGFYSDHYYHHGATDVNFNIWQVQAFSSLFRLLDDRQKAGLVAKFVIDLCQGIIDSRAWKYELGRGRSFYPNLDTVEIACGLDALVDGIHVAQTLAKSDPDNESKQQQAASFITNANNAVRFLQWAQDRVPPDSPAGFGGLGFGGTQVFEQRLDVTGHSISALTKFNTLCTRTAQQ